MADAPKPQRRLAAILAADVVGYSRLMQIDELGTLETLKARRRSVLEPSVTRHRGRIVKLMGDGVLVEFASVVDAVECAVQIQEQMARANEGVGPDRHVVLRIGVNLGDILVEGGDIYGDGVNIAARLEAMANPGDIFVSQAAVEQARGKTQVGFDEIGERLLKNMAAPVRICRVRRKQSTASPSAVPSVPDKPSLAVLPFENLSGDPEQRFFGDGIAEDIMTDLSKVSGLFVAARNSTFVFKDKPEDILQLARKLNVRYLLEGSVRRAGDRVRINVKLIDGSTGGQVWAERFDRTFSDIFALQDEISRSVIGVLRVKLRVGELDSLTPRSTASTQAYECYLQARSLLLHVSWTDRAALLAGRRLLQRAVEIDPNYARARAAIAETDAFLWLCGDSEVLFEEILANSERALSVSPDVAEAHAARGMALYLGGDSAAAEMAFDKALALDPGLWEALILCAFACRDSGQFEKAVGLYERASEINPDDWTSMCILSDVLAAMGDRQRSSLVARAAMDRIHSALARRPDNGDAISMGAATLALMDDPEAAAEWADRAIALSPESFTVAYNYASVQSAIGDHERALAALERICSQMPRARHWLLGMLVVDSQMRPLQDRADFQALVGRLRNELGRS